MVVHLIVTFSSLTGPACGQFLDMAKIVPNFRVPVSAISPVFVSNPDIDGNSLGK